MLSIVDIKGGNETMDSEARGLKVSLKDRIEAASNSCPDRRQKNQLQRMKELISIPHEHEPQGG